MNFIDYIDRKALLQHIHFHRNEHDQIEGYVSVKDIQSMPNLVENYYLQMSDPILEATKMQQQIVQQVYGYYFKTSTNHD